MSQSHELSFFMSDKDMLKMRTVRLGNCAVLYLEVGRTKTIVFGARKDFDRFSAAADAFNLALASANRLEEVEEESL